MGNIICMIPPTLPLFLLQTFSYQNFKMQETITDWKLVPNLLESTSGQYPAYIYNWKPIPPSNF